MTTRTTKTPWRGNITGHLRTLDRELKRVTAYAIDNHKGFALSGPDATAGPGLVSRKLIEHLKVRGACVHAVETSRSETVGTPRENDLKAVADAIIRAACVEPRPGAGLGEARGNGLRRCGGTPRARGALGPPRAVGRGAAHRGSRSPGEPLFDVQLLADREGVLHGALAAIRAGRARFEGLYAVLREDPLLPTDFEGAAVAFPDRVSAGERLLVWYR